MERLRDSGIIEENEFSLYLKTCKGANSFPTAVIDASVT